MKTHYLLLMSIFLILCFSSKIISQEANNTKLTRKKFIEVLYFPHNFVGQCFELNNVYLDYSENDNNIKINGRIYYYIFGKHKSNGSTISFGINKTRWLNNFDATGNVIFVAPEPIFKRIYKKGPNFKTCCLKINRVIQFQEITYYAVIYNVIY